MELPGSQTTPLRVGGDDALDVLLFDADLAEARRQAERRSQGRHHLVERRAVLDLRHVELAGHAGDQRLLLRLAVRLLKDPPLAQ